MEYFTDIVQKVIAFSVGSPVVAVVVQSIKNLFNLKGVAVRWIALLIGVVGSAILAATTTPEVSVLYHWLTHVGAGIIAGLTSWKIYEMARDAGGNDRN